MHITMLALGSTGDILPYAALGKGLRDAGCEVRFITFTGFENRVKQLGLDFHALPGDPQALVARGGTNILTMAGSFASLAEGYLQALSAPRLLETDLILNQLPGGLFGFDLAQKAGIRMIATSVIPLAPTSEFPMMGFPEVPLPGYNRASYRLAEIPVWMMFGRAINRWRRETLGLAEISRKDYFGPSNSGKNLIINGFSSKVFSRPHDWDEHIHITGYWFPEEPEWVPSPELEDFISRGPAPVFIGFGSLPLKDPRRITRIILEALRITNQRAVLGAGYGGIGDRELPDQVCRIKYAPYGWLFSRMSMVIHHGGSGTTGFALRAGVPSCALPLGFDQAAWGQRVASLGAGPEPLPLRNLTAERLAKVIRQGIEDQLMRRKSAAIGASLKTEDGIGKAVELIKDSPEKG